MRFVPHWDKKLISMLKECKSSKPILSAYPLGYELPNKIPKDLKPSVLVADYFGKDQMLRFKGKQLNQILDRPLPRYSFQM
jgi:[Skp1-protein]-hydroxyproline N-acetylglucosaminyltransferase